MFIINLSYQKSLNEVEQALQSHRKFLEKGYREKHFINSGPKVPRDGGVILAEFSSLEACHHYLSDDPFLKKGIARYTVIEFQEKISLQM